jgi:exodeoxyribonuclease VII large subunit
VPTSVYTVSELTREVRELIEHQFGEVWIEGEVSNHRHHSSGHHYFTLKDDRAQLSCVMFRGNARHLQMPLDNGQQIQASGDVSVYEARGQYQLIVKVVQPKGFGALQAKFEALKQKLEAEGLFAAEHKKPIPRSPQTIAIVTSPTGAAVQDFINVVRRRAPWVRVLVYPARVQGAGGEAEIAHAIRQLSDPAAIGLPPIDTIVVGRGGGSIEDLWNFNEEVVARAIFDCPIPVVSGVGHEIDFTIADFVADHRAPTPSAAAELVVPDGEALRYRIGEAGNTLRNTIDRRVENLGSHIAMLGRNLAAREPKRYVLNLRQSLDHLVDRMEYSLTSALEDSRNRSQQLSARIQRRLLDDRIDASRMKLQNLAERLESGTQRAVDGHRKHCDSLRELLAALNPANILARGFSMTTTANGTIIHSAEEVEVGDQLVSHLANGTLQSQVTARESEAEAEDA